MWNNLQDKYVLYGAGVEGEKFLFRHMELVDRIVFCIDGYRTGDFHGIPIKKIEEAENLFEYKILVAGLAETYVKLKSILESYDLVEFEHFNWIGYVEKKVVVINANCHGEALMKYLNMSKGFRENYVIYPIPAIHLNVSKAINPLLLKNTDVFIHQDVRRENVYSYELSDEYLLRQLPSECIRITIPNLVGMGHWIFPQHGAGDKMIEKPNGNIAILGRDLVLDEAFKNEDVHSIDDYRNFYTSFKFSKEYLEELKTNDMEKMKRREKSWDIQMSEYIECNCHNRACYVDKSHPSIEVIKQIGREVLKLLNLPDFNDEGYDYKLGLPMPLLPSVTEYFNLNYEQTEVAEYYGCTTEDLLDVYIKYYMWTCHDVKL